MGDYSSPKRRDVFDRLRRRIELYKKHHNKGTARYDNTVNNLYERGQQETLLLRERWLQSKAKKASKSKKESNSGEHRNTGITKLLKRKIDNNHSEAPNLDTSAFDFDEPDTITTQKTLKGGPGVDVSVRIVQEISGGNSQQVQTNVAVSTTVKTHIGSTTEHKDSSSTSVETNTKFECKQEPLDDIQCVKSNKSDISHTGSSEILDQEELEEILKTIEKDEGKLSDEIYEELKKFDQIYSQVSQEDSNDSTMFSNMTGTSPGLHKQPPYDPGNVSNSGAMFENPQPNPARTPSVPYRPPGTTMTETGPAAETLKQMAAQHQSSQHHTGTYGVKQFNPHAQNSSYNGYPANMDTTYTNQQGYVPQQNLNIQNGLLYQERHSDMYSSTKPLAHYPGSSGNNNTPSSLQQLQNQVQSFSQSKQMDITQTQQIQVSDESRRMQMSQTQQIHMRQPPQNISLSQHQSFSMANNMNQRQSPGYMTDQMKMQQMYQEKVQQEHHQKMQAVQMQQYNMGPPPEYKMQPSAQESYSTNMGRQNPLQTMQDMVEQTNSIPNLTYNNVKSESPNSHMMPPTPMVGVQHGTATSTHNPARLMSQNDLNPTGYHMSHMQRQQSYPGAHLDSHMSLQNRQNGNNFTSSIMRNQRPPNVNVGPDGLNISQPRNQDWPRHMLPQQGMPKPQNQNIMYNNSYASQTRTSVTNSMGIRPMQIPAQTAMMQNNAQTQHMMMQQHQNMHMTQRMAVPSHVASPNNTNFNQRQHQDDFMKILDSASQSGNSDYIDNMAAQSSGVSSDAAWLDEILSGK